MLGIDTSMIPAMTIRLEANVVTVLNKYCFLNPRLGTAYRSVSENDGRHPPDPCLLAREEQSLHWVAFMATILSMAFTNIS